MNRNQKQCTVCGQAFVPKTIDSVCCSKKCSNAAYREKKRQKRKDEEKKAVLAKISEDRLYISVPEAVALYNIAKSTLYRLIRQNRILAINLGVDL
mgnify:CR=1 FL=1